MKTRLWTKEVGCTFENINWNLEVFVPSGFHTRISFGRELSNKPFTFWFEFCLHSSLLLKFHTLTWLNTYVAQLSLKQAIDLQGGKAENTKLSQISKHDSNTQKNSFAVLWTNQKRPWNRLTYFCQVFRGKAEKKYSRRKNLKSVT